jgi:thymidylate synthase ThyX
MNIDSKLILASKSGLTGVTLYTFVLTYPRIILPEVNTHRALSRNTASSRAIPSKKQRDRVINEPFIPLHIGQNQRGMQAGVELKGWRRTAAIKTWEWARYPSVLASWILEKLGAHKQVVNRIVEPWTWTQQVVTATDLKNVFKLRNHSDAEPHFEILAKRMKEQVSWAETWFDVLGWGSSNMLERRLDANMELKGIGSIQTLHNGEWHLPFVDTQELREITDWDVLKKISTARCARTSYYLPESGARSDLNRDLELCGRLSDSGHWSPFEHVATPSTTFDYIGNFRSWKQYRKEFQEEAGGDR